MGYMVPTGVTISRASAEAAWKRHKKDGGSVTAGELDLTWEQTDSDLLRDSQRRMFFDFLLHKLTEEADRDETVDRTCGSD